jgi:hypothetical protein
MFLEVMWRTGTMRIESQADALRAAHEAIAAARKVLCNGNANPYSGIPGTQLRCPQYLMTEEVDKMRSIPNIYSRAMTSPDRHRAVKYTLCEAKIAEGAKCGNCGEHASVVFAMLFREGLYPISKRCFPGHWDHAFVIVGPRLRPDIAVICDAWADLYGLLGQWNAWKKKIWRDDPPPDNFERVCAEWNEPGGSVPRFNEWTGGQPKPDAMELW